MLLDTPRSAKKVKEAILGSNFECFLDLFDRNSEFGVWTTHPNFTCLRIETRNLWKIPTSSLTIAAAVPRASSSKDISFFEVTQYLRFSFPTFFNFYLFFSLKDFPSPYSPTAPLYSATPSVSSFMTAEEHSIAPTPTNEERPQSQMSSLYKGADSDENNDNDDVIQPRGKSFIRRRVTAGGDTMN